MNISVDNIVNYGASATRAINTLWEHHPGLSAEITDLVHRVEDYRQIQTLRQARLIEIRSVRTSIRNLVAISQTGVDRMVSDICEPSEPDCRKTLRALKEPLDDNGRELMERLYLLCHEAAHSGVVMNNCWGRVIRSRDALLDAISTR